jgi:hypothetical protein
MRIPQGVARFVAPGFRPANGVAELSIGQVLKEAGFTFLGISQNEGFRNFERLKTKNSQEKQCLVKD